MSRCSARFPRVLGPPLPLAICHLPPLPARVAERKDKGAGAAGPAPPAAPLPLPRAAGLRPAAPRAAFPPARSQGGRAAAAPRGPSRWAAEPAGPRPIARPPAPGSSSPTPTPDWRGWARRRCGGSRDAGQGKAGGPESAQWPSVPKAAHFHANVRCRLVMRLDKPL